MVQSHCQISNAVLLNVYPQLSRLDDFLTAHVGPSVEFLLRSDPRPYKDLIHNTLVATQAGKDTKPFPPYKGPSPQSCQDTIVDQAIELTSPKARSDACTNVLATGYFSLSTRPLKNIPRNSLEPFVRSALWETLTRRIGEDAMLYLLTATSIFASLPNNCYCQITGRAMNDLIGPKAPLKLHAPSSVSTKKRSAAALDIVSQDGASIRPAATDTCPSPAKPCKKKKGKEKKPANKDYIPLASIFFRRGKIFYAQKWRYDDGQFHWNRDATVDSLMKKMFPRQYGLKNVFQTKIPVHGIPSSTAPDGPQTKTPKRTWRLRQMQAFVETMLKQSHECKQRLLLLHYCPVKVMDDMDVGWDASSAELLKSDSSLDEVTSFVHSMVKKIIPLAMFGSEENRAVILRTMTRFIRLRKLETMSLLYALQGFRLNDCEWLRDQKIGQAGSGVHHVPPTASMKQHEILHEFIYWLFEGFLIPLIKANFYVSDSSYQRNKMLYFRHDLWRRITRPALATLKSRMFIKMQQNEVAACNRLYSTLRLLPKEHDLRPISNLRKKSSKLVNGMQAFGVFSANQQVANTFQVLSFERTRHSLNSSANGMSDLYQRLKQLKKKLVDASELVPKKLFMVKVDIKKSFDSINQTKLLEIMDTVLKEDKYLIHWHSKMIPANGRISKRFIKRALPVGDIQPFVEYASEEALASKNAVLVDKPRVVPAYQRKGDTLNLLRDHVQQNIVRFGKDFYRQTTGIPQGSVLSPALCRFFYDEMEKNSFGELAHSSDSALVRLADDFLFISKNVDKAKSFLNVMSAGHPEYGCHINEKKTIVNFDVALNGSPVQKISGNEFPYCGLLLHTRTLDISADYGRYHGEDVRDLLTVGRDKQPGKSIIYKMKKAMQHMCQMAFADTTHNSTRTVMRNVYQNFLFCAMKFHSYCQELLRDPNTRHHLQPSSLPLVVMGIFKACFGLLHNGCRSTIGVQAGVRFQVAESHVHWLGAMAFCTTLPRSEVYAPLRAALQEQILNPLSRGRNIQIKKMLFSVVKDPRNKIMEGIRF